MINAGRIKNFPVKIVEIIGLSFISVFLLSGGAAPVSYENHTVKLICLGIYVSAAVFFGMLHPEKKAGFIALSLTALTASVFLSGIFNPYLNSTLKTEQVYMFLNIIFIVILLQAAPVNVKKASLIIVLSAAVSVAAGLAQAAFFAAGEAVFFKDYFGGRVYSLFGNPDNFAVFLVFCAPFILQKSGSAGYKLRILLFLLSALSIFLSGSAAGIAVFCAVSAAVLIIQSKDKKKALALTAVIMTAAVLVSVFILNTKKDSVFIRVLLWKASVKMAAAQPLFGVGAANFRVQSPYYQSLVYDKDSNNAYKPHDEAYSHNDYLQALAETGILGLICFIFAVIACIVSLYRARSFAALAALSGILVFAFTHFPFNIPYFAVLFFVTAAVFGKDTYILSVRRPFLIAAGVILICFNGFMAGDIFIRNHIVFKMSSYINAGKANYALSYTRLFNRQIKRDYQGSFYAGLVMYGTGQVQKAEAYYGDALRLFPYFEGALFNLGNLHFRQGEYDKAAENYGRVLDINPLNAQATNNMGKVLIEQKKYQQAVILLEKAPPSQDDAYIKYNLALAYYMSDNGTKALKILKDLLELSPDFTPAEELLRKIKAGRGGV